MWHITFSITVVSLISFIKLSISDRNRTRNFHSPTSTVIATEPWVVRLNNQMFIPFSLRWSIIHGYHLFLAKVSQFSDGFAYSRSVVMKSKLTSSHYVGFRSLRHQSSELFGTKSPIIVYLLPFSQFQQLCSSMIHPKKLILPR